MHCKEQNQSAVCWLVPHLTSQRWEVRSKGQRTESSPSSYLTNLSLKNKIELALGLELGSDIRISPGESWMTSQLEWVIFTPFSLGQTSYPKLPW